MPTQGCNTTISVSDFLSCVFHSSADKATGILMLLLAAAPAWGSFAKEVLNGAAWFAPVVAVALGIAQLYLTILKIRAMRAGMDKDDD